MPGGALLQSPDEWESRNRALAESLRSLITSHVVRRTGRALDVGCQTGALIDLIGEATGLEWVGVDPRIEEPRRSTIGAELRHGWAHELEFDDASFDLVVFANVYEHVDPDLRDVSLREIQRVLTDGGVLVGQLPNPFFPIESHSRLPFMGWLPARLQKRYWRLSPVSWQHDFHSVTIRDLRRRARRSGLETVLVQHFNYPLEAIPRRIRPVARLMRVPMRLMPWSWQFVFRKPPKKEGSAPGSDRSASTGDAGVATDRAASGTVPGDRRSER